MKELSRDLAAMRAEWDWNWARYCLCTAANLGLDVALVFVLDRFLGDFYINDSGGNIGRAAIQLNFSP